MSAARKRPYFRLHTGYVALAEAHSASVRPSGPSASLSSLVTAQREVYQPEFAEAYAGGARNGDASRRTSAKRADDCHAARTEDAQHHLKVRWLGGCSAGGRSRRRGECQNSVLRRKPIANGTL